MKRQNIRCPFCDISQCRTSHFRFEDLIYLASMQLPVRCQSCQKRFHVGYRAALRMLHMQQSRSFLVREAEDFGRQQARDIVTSEIEGDH